MLVLLVPLYSALVQARTCPKKSSGHDFNFHFLRILSLHESCGGGYGSGPTIYEKGNLGEAKDQEDENNLIFAELVKAAMTFHLGLRADLWQGGPLACIVPILRDNLINSWYRRRSLRHVVMLSAATVVSGRTPASGSPLGDAPGPTFATIPSSG
ncbi:hypothetical protein F2Q68_00039280 [Brassica cretica]|uniref:Uncharacterized protein n=1 Tax=Brassica cretica TaxID=69181 RepID=A0A8S9MMK2_BRACR|nr:hypothetical protein F2Q68_00039280 [Brassica cretica]